MAQREDTYEKALEDKQIPILTEDEKWHKLFANADTTKAILKLEEQLEQMRTRQRRLKSDLAKVKELKKKLMADILLLAEEREHSKGKVTERKIDENKRLVEECSQKKNQWSRELERLEEDIEKTNHYLMLATMDACYDWLAKNARDIQDIDEWVTMVRVELKKRLVRKQEMQDQCQELYGYMHDIFGADVIDIFDMQYLAPYMKKGKQKNGEKK